MITGSDIKLTLRVNAHPPRLNFLLELFERFLSPLNCSKAMFADLRVVDCHPANSLTVIACLSNDLQPSNTKKAPIGAFSIFTK